MMSAMNVGESDARLAAPSPARRRAYKAMQAVLSDDHNYEAVRLQRGPLVLPGGLPGLTRRRRSRASRRLCDPPNSACYPAAYGSDFDWRSRQTRGTGRGCSDAG